MMDSAAGETALFHRRTKGSDFFRSASMTGRISHKGPPSPLPLPWGESGVGEAAKGGRPREGETDRPFASSAAPQLTAELKAPRVFALFATGPRARVEGEGACGKGKAGLPQTSSYRINPRE